MRYSFSLLIVISLLATASVQGQGKQKEMKIDSGAFLYDACQIRLKVIDNASFVPTPLDATHALMCQSYVQGFTDGMLASSHDFCIKPVTQEQAIRKYVAFMTENPIFLKEDKMMSLALVLHPLYSCTHDKQ
jgi:hypothetical protein